ncbi:hypothetical protein H0H87_003003 [Tephrocybe sp. NHM501043]|nr:hypothetical protein H0H87_003003 [Tephrocybe sp. NHM501043]
MRTSTPPCGDLPWHQIDLRAVDAVAAHEIYTSWHPKGRDDTGVSQLLESIDNMPLGILLLAKVAKVTHLSAQALMDEYDKQGTLILGQGLDAESNMDVCIGLSVYSSRMKAHPEAFYLLCIISMLPVGTSYTMLSKWWARDLTSLVGALEVLQSTSLVEVRDSTIFVLPVIQRYILHPSRFLEQVRSSMLETASLALEDSNLEAVLLTAEVLAPHIIWDGFLTLTRYHWMYRPHVDLVVHGLALARGVDDPILRGDLLFCYGNIYLRLQQFDNALKQFNEALDIFLSLPDRKRSGECRLEINNVLLFRPEGKRKLREKFISEAKDDFEAIYNKSGTGRCLVALANLRDTTTRISVLKQAELVFAEANDRRRRAECALYLVRAYYNAIDYDSSYNFGISAIEQYESIGYPPHSAFAALARTLSARGDHESSLRHYLRCLEIRQSAGLSPQGTTLEGMGLIWVKLGKNTDARRAFEQSLEQYTSEEPSHITRNGVIRCLFLLRRLDDTGLEPTQVELASFRGRYSEDHINRILAPL